MRDKSELKRFEIPSGHPEPLFPHNRGEGTTSTLAFGHFAFWPFRREPRFSTIQGRRKSQRLGSVLCLLIFATGCGSKPALEVPNAPPSTPSASATASRELAVAAAADLKFVMADVVSAFEKEHPNVHVNATFGASGSLFAQLSNRAPFDIFMSADISYPRKLVEDGLADDKTLFSYAIGQIVVWVPKESPLDVESRGIDVLTDALVKKIAIANPKHAPYGRAAEAAMKELGVYDKIVDRLVLGENVAQAAQFVETGAADVGIVAHSFVMAPALRDKGRYWIVPQSAYPPIEQGGVIVSWARDREIAEQFRSFLIGEGSRSIFQKYGFTLPEAP